MSQRRKALTIIFGALLLMLIVGIAAGSPGSHKPPGPRTPATKAAAVPGSALGGTHRIRHHHREHHHREHRHKRIKHHGQPIISPAASPPAPAGCYPLSNEGTCYEPGEFCRDSDHGARGLAGDGERIVCEDNNGWRWEPA
jgi:hypothetical protein